MRVAITGVISSGKSTVLKRLKDLGYNVLSCDEIVKELYEEDYVKELILNNFDALTDNKIDRKKLANIIFESKVKREQLNNLIHPLVLKRILSNKDDLLFVEVPLLFETGFDKYFDKTILVYVNEQEAIKRLIKRDKISYEDALKRIKSQKDINVLKTMCDYVIDNSYEMSQTYKNIDSVIKEINYGDKLK